MMIHKDGSYYAAFVRTVGDKLKAEKLERTAGQNTFGTKQKGFVVVKTTHALKLSRGINATER